LSFLILVFGAPAVFAQQTPQELIDSATCTNAGCHGGKVGNVSGVDAAKARVLAANNPMPPGGASDEIKAVFEGTNGGAPDAGAEPDDADKPDDPDADAGSGANNPDDPFGGTDTSGDDNIGVGAGTQPPGEGDDTPLILDLNGDGQFALEKRLVRFDFAASGNSWVTEWPNRFDGFLALDLDENGVIDSGLELFGNRSGALDVSVDDGFQALERYDDNNDGLIDSNDQVFRRLLVWRDQNSNGRSEARELKLATELGISEFSLKTVGDANTRVIKKSTYKQGSKEFVLADLLINVVYGVEVGKK
jgi:hypothetical protein